jgi:type I restriction enzyme R subunit
MSAKLSFCTYRPEHSLGRVDTLISLKGNYGVLDSFPGEIHGGGAVKLKSGKGKKGSGPLPKKVSVQDMISEIRAKFDISDEEALHIKEVTGEKVADPVIRSTVTAHWEDRVYLEGAYRGQVNGEIQTAYNERGRYEELSD